MGFKKMPTTGRKKGDRERKREIDGDIYIKKEREKERKRELYYAVTRRLCKFLCCGTGISKSSRNVLYRVS